MRIIRSLFDYETVQRALTLRCSSLENAHLPDRKLRFPTSSRLDSEPSGQSLISGVYMPFTGNKPTQITDINGLHGNLLMILLYEFFEDEN